MPCQHGKNLKHQRCYECEDVAAAENKATSKTPPTRKYSGRGTVPVQPQPNGQLPHPVHINMNRLDWEWARQSELYFHEAEKCVQLRLAWEEAKAMVKVEEAQAEEIYAKLSLSVRRFPDKFDLEKVSEDAVKMTVLTQPAYRKALETVHNTELVVIKAKHALDQQDVLVKALDHKKVSLESLTFLWGRQYFGDPKTPRDMTQDEVDTVKSKLRNRSTT